MSVSLTLGGVAFDGFEVPAQVAFGGRQTLSVHELAGGGRVVDVLGRDDSDLIWSGTFTGPNASLRARQLDAMRASGTMLPLAWDAFSYLVIIAELQLTFKSPWWIQYRIVCTVIADKASSAPLVSDDLAGNITSDLASAELFFDASVAASALLVTGALSPGNFANSAALLSLQLASANLNAAIASTEAKFLSDRVLDLVEAAGTLAGLCCAKGFLDRARANFSEAGS